MAALGGTADCPWSSVEYATNQLLLCSRRLVPLHMRAWRVGPAMSRAVLAVAHDSDSRPPTPPHPLLLQVDMEAHGAVHLYADPGFLNGYDQVV